MNQTLGKFESGQFSWSCVRLHFWNYYFFCSVWMHSGKMKKSEFSLDIWDVLCLYPTYFARQQLMVGKIKDPIPSIFFLYFYKQLKVSKCLINISGDWIRTHVLWYQKRPLHRVNCATITAQLLISCLGSTLPAMLNHSKNCLHKKHIFVLPQCSCILSVPTLFMT